MNDVNVTHANNATIAGQRSAIAVNKVLKNTYLLLAMTLAFSAVTALLSFNAQPIGIFPMLIGFYGLLFLTHKLANSAWGLLAVFAFTGFLGYTIGPMMGMLMSMSGGSEVVAKALGGTAFIFFGLSGYALVSRKDFSFLSGFLFAGFLVLLAAMVVQIFWPMPALQLAMSVGFILFSSAVILYQTGEIVRGGEQNYILATVTLFVSLYNIFISLVNLLMAFSGDE
jgi:modulator of FtsH protease